jgi:drug/metabolite transporter (DMT)-like permease
VLADERKARYIAMAEGVVVTLILGSTLPVVKMALDYLGPLTITSLRYSLAFLLLFPFMARRGLVRHWPFRLWIRLFCLSLGFYVIGNGALFWGLKYIVVVGVVLVQWGKT